MAVSNSINESTTGICGFTGTAFTGTPVTAHNVLIGGSTSSTIAQAAPSATAGVPLVSGGASADPSFTTAVVAGGGTGQVTLTNHGVLVGAGTSAITQLAAGSAGQVLQSGGASADPAYSTATYPSTATGTGTILRADGTNWLATTSTYPNTNAVSTLLYASSSNVMSALSTANDGLLVTSNTGVPSILAGPGTTGNILQSNAAAAPSFSTATYPSASGGSGKILYDNGTNFVESTPTFPASASATSRKIIVSDGTNWVASTETWAVPGSSGNILTSNGTNWTSAAPASPFAPNTTIQLYDDFVSTFANSASFLNSTMQWSYAHGLVASTASDSTHIGIVGNSALTSLNFCIVSDNNPPSGGEIFPFVLGGGAITLNFVLKLATLSTSTNRYTLYFGLGDTVTAADQANGVYFAYSDNLNSANWVGKTAASSSRSSANSAVAGDTNYHNFQISINAAATSVSYFIDGVQIANSPLATNIPSAGLGIFMNMVWSAGTVAARSLAWDLVYYSQTLTTPR